MKSSRIVRTLALLATASLVMGIFATLPAEAARRKKRGCAAYTPGEAGKGLPVTKVTNAATADAPAEVEVELGPGVGAGRSPEPPPDGEGQFVSHAFSNLQVDTTGPSTTLFVEIAWDVPVWDYDVYLDTNTGTEVANSAGFGPVTSGSDYAASGVGTETITAFPTTDCAGFTVDVVGATTPGGPVTIKYWVE